MPLREKNARGGSLQIVALRRAAGARASGQERECASKRASDADATNGHGQMASNRHALVTARDTKACGKRVET